MRMGQRFACVTWEKQTVKRRSIFRANSIEKNRHVLFRSWAEMYDTASMEAPKMIVSCLSKRVEVYRDYKLHITS